jgi:acetylornithine deacetylase
MAAAVTALSHFDAEVLRGRVDPLVGPASLHCATIRGGIGLSTYAPECTLGIERRTLPGESAEQALREIEAVVRAAGVDAEVSAVFDRSPLRCDRDSAIARCVREAAAHVTGETPEEVGVPYWMDAAIFADAGIPTVDYGPAGEGAHETTEWVDLGSLVTCSRVLAEACEAFARTETESQLRPASNR